MSNFCKRLNWPVVLLTRSQTFTAEVVTIHNASSSPRLARAFHWPIINGRMSAATRLAAKAQRKRTYNSGKLAFFQRAMGPMPIRNAAGTINGTSTAVKYGGRTESFPSPSASIISGYNVPSNTEPAATVNKTLFESKRDSREINSNFEPRPTCFARHAYSSNDPPITTNRKARIKMPRFGSEAKAYTEVSTPERTKNVPTRLSENAAIASSTVQLLNPPRFSVTASEWIKAVPT